MIKKVMKYLKENNKKEGFWWTCGAVFSALAAITTPVFFIASVLFDFEFPPSLLFSAFVCSLCFSFCSYKALGGGAFFELIGFYCLCLIMYTGTVALLFCFK